jgi:hypothetical protein
MENEEHINRIGLHRSRLKDDFSDVELEAAIYYLRNLTTVQEAIAA